MKKLLSLSLITLLGGLIVMSTPIRAQENKKVEKKMRIKTVKEVDGKMVKMDTTIIITDDMNPEELEALGINYHGDETKMTVFLDSDGNKTTKKVVVVNGSDVHVTGDDSDVHYFHSDGSKGTAIIKWTDEEGEEMTFDIDMEMESGLEGLEEIRKELEVEIHVVDGERIIIMKELEGLEDEMKNIELEVFAELGEFDELRDFNVKVIGAPHHPNAFFIEEHSHKVSDIELRDAGIKNKANRLDANEMNLNVDNGVVDFSFKTKTEGTPKVTVYNVYGDKVFSGKPELMNDTYEIKMDLSQKQYGMYYLQVVIGNASFTERLKL